MLDKLAVLSGYDYFLCGCACISYNISVSMRVRNFRNNVLKKE